MTETQGVRLGIVRGIGYGLFGPPDEFVPQVRDLGGTAVRLYAYWSQVEPEPGVFDWTVVDAWLAQLDGSEEVWVTVCSSSRWATTRATDFLPPSPALDADAYHRFVRALVGHCAGRVAWWQCENEPTNAELWAGTAAEYTAQLATFHRAVKEADPGARVVLAGCGHDVLSSAERSDQRAFFDQVLAGAEHHFDAFDVHLYGDVASIPAKVESVRAMMRAHGYGKPVLAGEYNGPAPFDHPEAERAMFDALSAAFVGQDALEGDTSELAPKDGPERRAMVALYERMGELPEQLQMFMDGCAPELRARRERETCRQLVMRNLLALSTGIRRTLCWNLAPEVPNAHDPYRIMSLMFDGFALLDYAGTTLGVRRPAAHTFALLAEWLDGVTGIVRLDEPTGAELYAFAVDRGGRGPGWVLWRDVAETDPPVAVELPAPPTRVVDAFGVARPNAGRTVDVGRTPLLVE